MTASILSGTYGPTSFHVRIPDEHCSSRRAITFGVMFSTGLLERMSFDTASEVGVLKGV